MSAHSTIISRKGLIFLSNLLQVPRSFIDIRCTIKSEVKYRTFANSHSRQSTDVNTSFCNFFSKRGSKTGFVGSGNMAEAMMRGLLDPAGVVVPENIFAADISEKRLDDLHNRYKIQTHTDNKEVVKNADIVILSVKPQIIQTVLQF